MSGVVNIAGMTPEIIDRFRGVLMSLSICQTTGDHGWQRYVSVRGSVFRCAFDDADSPHQIYVIPYSEITLARLTPERGVLLIVLMPDERCRIITVDHWQEMALDAAFFDMLCRYCVSRKIELAFPHADGANPPSPHDDDAMPDLVACDSDSQDYMLVSPPGRRLPPIQEEPDEDLLPIRAMVNLPPIEARPGQLWLTGRRWPHGRHWLPAGGLPPIGAPRRMLAATPAAYTTPAAYARPDPYMDNLRMLGIVEIDDDVPPEAIERMNNAAKRAYDDLVAAHAKFDIVDGLFGIFKRHDRMSYWDSACDHVYAVDVCLPNGSVSMALRQMRKCIDKPGLLFDTVKAHICALIQRSSFITFTCKLLHDIYDTWVSAVTVWTARVRAATDRATELFTHGMSDPRGLLAVCDKIEQIFVWDEEFVAVATLVDNARRAASMTYDLRVMTCEQHAILQDIHTIALDATKVPDATKKHFGVKIKLLTKFAQLASETFESLAEPQRTRLHSYIRCVYFNLMCHGANARAPPGDPDGDNNTPISAADVTRYLMETNAFNDADMRTVTRMLVYALEYMRITLHSLDPYGRTPAGAALPAQSGPGAAPPAQNGPGATPPA